MQFPVRMETDLGIFPNGRQEWSTTAAAGRVRILLYPDKIAGSGTVKIHAGLTETEHPVAFHPGPAHMIQLSFQPELKEIGSGSGMMLSFLVMDKYSNRVDDDTPIRLQADQGNLERTDLQTYNGIASTHLTPVEGSSVAVIKATVPDRLRPARSTFRFCALLPGYR